MKEHYLRPQTPSVEPDPVDKIKGSIRKPEEAQEKGKDGLYSVDYFQFEGWGEILLDERLDVHGARDKMVYIENFIEEQISKEGLNPTKESFEAILSEIEKSLKLSKYHDQFVRLDKVHKYFKVMAKDASERRKIKSMIANANQEAERQKKDFYLRKGLV